MQAWAFGAATGRGVQLVVTSLDDPRRGEVRAEYLAHIQKVYRGTLLRRGITTSCGCWRRERITKHGHAVPKNTSPEYGAWRAMLDRCLNPNSKRWDRFGERGVKVCNRWNPRAGGSFENFLQDMGPRSEPKGACGILRINNDLDYTLTNCRWGTRRQPS